MSSRRVIDTANHKCPNIHSVLILTMHHGRTRRLTHHYGPNSQYDDMVMYVSKWRGCCAKGSRDSSPPVASRGEVPQKLKLAIFKSNFDISWNKTLHFTHTHTVTSNTIRLQIEGWSLIQAGFPIQAWSRLGAIW